MIARVHNQPRWAHNLFFLCMTVFLTAGALVKFWDAGSIIALFVVSLIYSALERPPFIKSLALFSLIGVTYVGMSYSDILPSAWTRLYDKEYIPRQAYFVFLFYPLATASMLAWRDIIVRRAINGRIIMFLFMLMVISPILVMTFAPIEKLALSFQQFGLQQYFFYGLGNRELVVWLVVTYLPLVRYPQSRFVVLPLLAAMIFLTAESTQIALMAPVLLVIGFAPPGLLRPALAGMIATVALITVYSLLQLRAAADVTDPNTTLRALFWYDAWAGFWDSHMLGIGFGKEVTSEYYPMIMDPLPPTSHEQFMTIGIHNSFLSMFFRMGLFGGLVFLWFFFVTCLPPVEGININVARHNAVVYFACFMSNFVNVGVESPRMLIGNAFCLGYILACKYLADKNQARQRAMEEAISFSNSSANSVLVTR